MQFQSDILGTDVVRPEVTETTALGAAYLAGLAVGFWENKEEILENFAVDRQFKAEMPVELKEEKYAGWKRAVERSMKWES